MTLILAAPEIEALLADVDVIGVVEAIHVDLGTGAMTQPSPSALTGGDDSILLPMAARSDRLGLAAVKLMADIPRNIDRGLPTQRSTILVSSVETGESVAVLDGAMITRLRTAAASAVATRHLARRGPAVLGLVGAGNLAVAHVMALRTVMELDRLVVWSRSPETVGRFVDAVAEFAPALTVDVAADARGVVTASDVVCTVTPSIDPIVKGSWLRPGQHINAVGARPRPTHRELDAAAMGRGTLVVDSAATSRTKSGDLIQALREGALGVDPRLRELGEVVAGIAPARISPDEITVFDSVGIAAQDLAVAAAVIDLAIARGVGDERRLAPVAVRA